MADYRRILTALLCAALLTAACASDSADSAGPDSTGSTTTSATGNNPKAVEEAAAIDASQCADDVIAAGDDGETVVSIVERAAEENGLTSVVYRVTRGDEVVAVGTIGDSMTGVPATQDMQFRVGNVVFAYMGTLLLLFDESGEASLDDPISKWLPQLDLPSADEVTLQMLARNTSGYPDYVRTDEFVDAFLDDPFRGYTPEELLDIAFAIPPWYEPGAGWNYSHTNYVILGEALAAIGDQPLEDLLRDRVIGPMDLPDTAPQLTPALPEPALHSFSAEREVFEDTTFWNPSWQTAPGSVVSSNICDLATSAAAVGTGDLLSEESFEAMLAPVSAELDPPPESCPEGTCIQNTDERYYGLGVIVGSGWISQGPLFGGAGGVHAYLPDEELSVAILAVSGQETEPNTNVATQIWVAIGEALTPDNVPPF